MHFIFRVDFEIWYCFTSYCFDYTKDGVIEKLLFAPLDDETCAYISVWDPFRGSFVLASVTSASTHTQVYVRTYVCHEWQ